MLLTLQKLDYDGYTINVLMVVITWILAYYGKMECHEIVAKLICVEADGVSSFLGCKKEMSKQLPDNWCPLFL